VEVVLIISLVTNIIFAIKMYVGCNHKWNDWSGWSAQKNNLYKTEFIRIRSCTKCGYLDQQAVCKHDCFGYTHCPHIKDFIKSTDKGIRIKDLEKELGI
jgi:hypothetical protein